MAAGHSWKHNWIPLTPEAARQKNHGRTPKSGSSVSDLMDSAIRSKARERQSRPRGPMKAPRDLSPGDVIDYHGVPMTVLSKPREGDVRGNKTVWGRRHDTGKTGRVDFLGSSPMEVHGSEKISAADVKAHQAKLKASVDAQRARVHANRIERHVKAATDAEKAGNHAAAISHLTDAMNKSSGAEWEALKAHRDRLARKVMHGTGKPSAGRADHFARDLDKINATLHKLGAVVTTKDGFTHIDESKVPADLMRTYRRLVQYGAANGLL